MVAQDQDHDKLRYSIKDGDDATLFSIDPDTGILNFLAAPDFENPQDVGGDNNYNLNLMVSDGQLVTEQAVTVYVDNVVDAPSIVSSSRITVQENSSYVYQVSGHHEWQRRGMALTYSISGGVDRSRFSIYGNTGDLYFDLSAGQPNYEVPEDFGRDNVYDVEIKVEDGISATTKAIAIVVTDVNEFFPVFTTGKQPFVAENEGFVTDVQATDTDGTSTLTYSKAGGADQLKFTIDPNTGKLSFIVNVFDGKSYPFKPNYENPQDAGRDNVYDVTVQVSDGQNIRTQDIAVKIKNVNEAPSITSARVASVSENQTAALTVGVNTGASLTLATVTEINCAPNFLLPSNAVTMTL